MADTNDKHALERLLDEIVDCAVSMGKSDAMKGFGAFTEIDSISMSAMRKSISQKRAQILGHFDETAAPPAGSALAEMLEHMEHGAKLADAIGSLCRDGTTERKASDAIRKAAAALRARTVPVMFPRQTNGEGGWTIDTNYIAAIRKDCPVEWQPCEEETEAVLLAVERERAMLAASKEDGK